MAAKLFNCVKSILTDSVESVLTGGVIISGDPKTAGILYDFSPDGKVNYKDKFTFRQSRADSISITQIASPAGVNVPDIYLIVGTSITEFQDATYYYDVSDSSYEEVTANVKFNGRVKLTAESTIYVAETVTSAAGVQITIDSSGYYSYTPPTDFTGVDKFTYHLSNGSSQTAMVQNVAVTFTPGNSNVPCLKFDNYEGSGRIIFKNNNFVNPSSFGLYLSFGAVDYAKITSFQVRVNLGSIVSTGSNTNYVGALPGNSSTTPPIVVDGNSYTYTLDSTNHGLMFKPSGTDILRSIDCTIEVNFGSGWYPLTFIENQLVEVGNVLELAGGFYVRPAKIQVTSVSDYGSITGYNMIDGGLYYVYPTTTATSETPLYMRWGSLGDSVNYGGAVIETITATCNWVESSEVYSSGSWSYGVPDDILGNGRVSKIVEIDSTKIGVVFNVDSFFSSSIQYYVGLTGKSTYNEMNTNPTGVVIMILSKTDRSVIAQTLITFGQNTASVYLNDSNSVEFDNNVFYLRLYDGNASDGCITAIRYDGKVNLDSIWTRYVSGSDSAICNVSRFAVNRTTHQLYGFGFGAIGDSVTQYSIAEISPDNGDTLNASTITFDNGSDSSIYEICAFDCVNGNLLFALSDQDAGISYTGSTYLYSFKPGSSLTLNWVKKIEGVKLSAGCISADSSYIFLSGSFTSTVNTYSEVPCTYFGKFDLNGNNVWHKRLRKTNPGKSVSFLTYTQSDMTVSTTLDENSRYQIYTVGVAMPVDENSNCVIYKIPDVDKTAYCPEFTFENVSYTVSNTNHLTISPFTFNQPGAISIYYYGVTISIGSDSGIKLKSIDFSTVKDGYKFETDELKLSSFYLKTDGALEVRGDVGTSGQVLTSRGDKSVEWSNGFQIYSKQLYGDSGFTNSSIDALSSYDFANEMAKRNSAEEISNPLGSPGDYVICDVPANSCNPGNHNGKVILIGPKTSSGWPNYGTEIANRHVEPVHYAYYELGQSPSGSYYTTIAQDVLYKAPLYWTNRAYGDTKGTSVSLLTGSTVNSAFGPYEGDTMGVMHTKYVTEYGRSDGEWVSGNSYLTVGNYVTALNTSGMSSYFRLRMVVNNSTEEPRYDGNHWEEFTPEYRSWFTTGDKMGGLFNFNVQLVVQPGINDATSNANGYVILVIGDTNYFIPTAVGTTWGLYGSCVFSLNVNKVINGEVDFSIVSPSGQIVLLPSSHVIITRLSGPVTANDKQNDY